MYIYISRRVLIVLSVILLLVVASGAALAGAMSQNEDNVINACYHNRTGALRIVSDPSECRPSESPIWWNQVGPQGPPGPPGGSGPFPFFVCPGCDWRYIGDKLIGVDLAGAYMPFAQFESVNLSGVVFSDAILVNANFMQANLSGSKLLGTDLRGANIGGADFTDANLAGSNLSPFHAPCPDEFAHCTIFTNANLTGVDMSHAWGDKITMRNAVLVDANLAYVSFNLCDLSNADLTRANLTGAGFYGCDFTGANLTDAVLEDVRWEATICPDGTNSDDNGGTCEGHLIPGG